MNGRAKSAGPSAGSRRRLASVGAILACSASAALAQDCQWEALAGTGEWDLRQTRTLLVHDDGTGPALFAAGTMSDATGGPAPGKRIAKWDGEAWAPLGEGLGSSVQALISFDDGTGSALYAAGSFSRAGEVPNANGIARWDGRQWSALGSGLRNEDPSYGASAWALAVFDDGSGPALYVAGGFTEAGGVPARNIARWDGRRWSALGAGLSAYQVRALAVFDDGRGPALYAGGYIDGGGVARWDGESWERIPGVSIVESLGIFDDGSGPALYAGGGVPYGIARWTGAGWVQVGGASSSGVETMRVFDDGTGPALYVGVPLLEAPGVSAWGVARWDGRAWSSLDAGLYKPVSPFGGMALEVFDDGAGPALYVGGDFIEAGGVPVNSIARWRCVRTCYADCDRSGLLDFFDFLCFQNEFAAMTPYGDCDGSGSHDLFDFLCFQSAFAAGCE